MPCGPATGIAGPAILEEREATTVIPPADRLAVDDGLNLSITIGEGQKPIALVTPGTPRAEGVSEVVRLKIADIDSGRMLIRVEQCKGADRHSGADGEDAGKGDVEVGNDAQRRRLEEASVVHRR
jgi:hypothetical protein